MSPVLTKVQVGPFTIGAVFETSAHFDRFNLDAIRLFSKNTTHLVTNL